MNYRLLFILVFAINLCVACFVAYADQTDRFKNYTYPTMEQLTDYAFDSGLIKLTNEQDAVGLIEYKDCNLYDSVKDNLFKQQQLFELFSAGQKERIQTFSKEFKIKLDDAFLLDKYNFSTQSFDIAPRFRMNKVGIIGILRSSTLPCSKMPSGLQGNIPSVYAVKLNFPVSLLRLPFQPDTAENIIKSLDKTPYETQYRIAYVRLYISIEGILPTLDYKMEEGRRAMLLGQIDAIDIFSDAARTKRIKRLDYSAAY